MKSNSVSLAIAILFCINTTSAQQKTVNKPLKKFDASMVEKDAFIFLVFGDWGRNGELNQTEVAQSMKRISEIADPQFIISTGDNFYSKGVASTHDPQWTNSFENVYKGNALQIDWYPVLGNHDYNGNPQAEIDYTQKSRRWVMPARYHTFTRKADDGNKIRFIFMDSSPFVAKYHAKKESYSDLSKQDTLKQLKWMDSVFSAAATDKWKFVIGHHPIYSSSPKHGDTRELHTNVKPKLEKNNVQAYFCGHDHDLQHQKPKGSNVDYFVSGAGSEVRSITSYEHTVFVKGVPGFALVSIKGDIFTLYYIDTNGNVLYKYSRKN